jgi:spore coat protein A, manganese oxidase
MRAYRIVLNLLIVLASFGAKATVHVVYTFNNEFSINQPGQPLVNIVTITAGDTVRWVRLQGGHTTTSVAGSPEQWDSELNNSITEFERQFNNPGTFWYYCIPHGTDNGDGTASGMHGRVVVLAAGNGACCMPDGSCMLTDAGGCAGMGGTFQGTGTSCTPNPCNTGSTSATLQALKDNSIYSESGTVNNGGGTSIFAGIRQNNTRRGLLAFDLSSLPAGVTITAVEVRLNATTVNGTNNLALHRLNASWGEGTAAGNLNGGATATAGSATWTHRQFNTTTWTTAGADFQATASASQSVAATGAITITSPALLADVQMWQSMPSMNHGWILRANEVTNNTNLSFGSRENATASLRPQLVVTYVMTAGGACCLPDGMCTVNSEGECTALGGSWQGAGTTCANAGCTVTLMPFMDPLPLPGVAQPVTGQPGAAAHYAMSMTEQFQQLHSQLPATRVWGYNGGYPGPTIEARRGQPVTVTWTNDLRVAETNVLRSHHVLAIDECLHGPHETGHAPVAVVHLHGGKVAPDSDGDPETAFPPGQSSTLYTYPNDQPAATIWYHDHALGITRLNVMMGLAGFYLIRDDHEETLNLPSGMYEVPLAIQDRSFNPDGSLAYPEQWHEHFFGDKILVNGKVWPYLNVHKGKYRFRMLNGSNSRTYTLALSNGATFWQIGTDQGLVNAPVPLTQLTIMPGERAEIVVDFAGYATGTEIILTNSAPAPFPGFPGVGVVPEVMKFIVQAPVGHTASLPAAMATIQPLPVQEAFIHRDFDLRLMPNYCTDHHDLMWSINGMHWDDITEFPILGATEVWNWINNSGIAHPMHMHLVLGQVLNRQEIDQSGVPFGPVYPPEPNEIGWKDTWNCPTGYVTRVIARFEGFTGAYPYHCHILEHEDHEMMRQFVVQEPVRVAARVILEGPYQGGSGLMNDALRVQGLLPLTEPYSALGFTLRGGAGSSTKAETLDLNGPDAIVDWLLLELRHALFPDSILRTRTALLQRDGDVVGLDGEAPVAFDLPPGSYHLAVRHRNHLGTMTAQPLLLDHQPVPVDLSLPGTSTWGFEGRRTINGVMALWAGNVLRDQLLNYTGADNDRDPILQAIGGITPTNITTGYRQEDVNLDGVVKYTGSGNDRDPILVNIGGAVPTNVRVEQLP